MDECDPGAPLCYCRARLGRVAKPNTIIVIRNPQISIGKYLGLLYCQYNVSPNPQARPSSWRATVSSTDTASRSGEHSRMRRALLRTSRFQGVTGCFFGWGAPDCRRRERRRMPPRPSLLDLSLEPLPVTVWEQANPVAMRATDLPLPRLSFTLSRCFGSDSCCNWYRSSRSCLACRKFTDFCRFRIGAHEDPS